MVSKNMLRVIIILLGILIALPVWQLSGMLLWGLLCGATTMLVLVACLTARIYEKDLRRGWWSCTVLVAGFLCSGRKLFFETNKNRSQIFCKRL